MSSRARRLSASVALAEAFAWNPSAGSRSAALAASAPVDARLRLRPGYDGQVGDGRLGEGRLGEGRLGEGRLGDGRLGDGRLGDGRLGDGRLGEPSLPYTGPPTVAEQQAQLAELEREAFTKGYAQGERTGLEAGGKRAEAMLRRLAETLEEMTTLRENMVRQTERELVQLAVAIARRILQREATVDPDLTAALAHIAIERLGGAAPAVVRLHPDDYAIVTGGHSGSLAGRQVQILPDPGVARGGCLVESEFGYIDASVDAQVDEIARSVLGDAPVATLVRRGAA